MTISPKVYAGHKAVTELLASMDVRIKHPEQSVRDFGMFMPDHSVNVSCWMDHVVVTYAGTNDDQRTEPVPYPVSHEDPGFTSKLGEVLLPVVEEYLSRIPAVQDAR